MSSKTKRIVLNVAEFGIAFCSGCAIAAQEKENNLGKVGKVITVVGDLGQCIGTGTGIALFFEQLKGMINE